MGLVEAEKKRERSSRNHVRRGRTGGATSHVLSRHLRLLIPQALQESAPPQATLDFSSGFSEAESIGLMLDAPPQEDGPTDSRALSCPCPLPGSSVARRSRRRNASSGCVFASRPTRQGGFCLTRAWCPLRTAPPLSCAREERASLGQCPPPSPRRRACGFASIQASREDLHQESQLEPPERPVSG